MKRDKWTYHWWKRAMKHNFFLCMIGMMGRNCFLCMIGMMGRNCFLCMIGMMGRNCFLCMIGMMKLFSLHDWHDGTKLFSYNRTEEFELPTVDLFMSFLIKKHISFGVSFTRIYPYNGIFTPIFYHVFMVVVRSALGKRYLEVQQSR